MIVPPSVLVLQVCLKAAEVVCIELDLASFELVPCAIRRGLGDAVIDVPDWDIVGLFVIKYALERRDDLDKADYT